MLAQFGQLVEQGFREPARVKDAGEVRQLAAGVECSDNFLDQQTALDGREGPGFRLMART